MYNVHLEYLGTTKDIYGPGEEKRRKRKREKGGSDGGREGGRGKEGEQEGRRISGIKLAAVIPVLGFAKFDEISFD